MQEHSSTKKRRQVALRFFTYGVMTLATAVISIICILLVLGYQFDFTKHTVSQGGLFQFRSFPEGASINLDRSTLSFLTPGKRNVEAGKHTVTYRLDGYREWSKTVPITAGELRWLNYARLVPQSVTTTAVKEFPVVTSSLPTPDRKWMAIYGAADKPELTLADLRDSENYKLQPLVIPPAAYTNIEGQAHQFKPVEWDFSGRYLLIKHVIGDQTEFIRVDRTKPEEAKNITTQLSIALSELHFSGTSGDIYYGLQGTDIRKLDIAGGTISEPIAGGVGSFTLYKTNDLAYVRDTTDKRVVGVSIDGKAAAVRSYDTTEPVLADLTSYFSRYYVAIARGTHVEVIKDGQDKNNAKTVATFQVPAGVKWLQFANNGRFVVAGNGTQFVTYDLETKEQFSVNLPGNSADPVTPLQWLDDYILVSTYDKNLRLTEFDGGNQQVITDAEPGFAVTLTDDGKQLLSITRTTNGYALQSSTMVIED